MEDALRVLPAETRWCEALSYFVTLGAVFGQIRPFNAVVFLGSLFEELDLSNLHGSKIAQTPISRIDRALLMLKLRSVALHLIAANFRNVGR